MKSASAKSCVGGRIEIKPGYAGGEPHIKGWRIKVRNIVYWHKHMGLTLDEIAYQYRVAHSDINAALTYYSAHREEIDRDIRDVEAFGKGAYAGGKTQTRGILRMAGQIRFYTDENVSRAVIGGLRRPIDSCFR